MRRTLLCHVSVLFVIFQSITIAFGEAPKVEKPDANGVALFDKQIKPALVKNCYECHSSSAEEIEGGLELDSPAGMRRGGDSGPMLTWHDVQKSPLIRMLRHEEDVSGMPPENKLPDEVILAFEEWVRLGAPDSRESQNYHLQLGCAQRVRDPSTSAEDHLPG